MTVLMNAWSDAVLRAKTTVHRLLSVIILALVVFLTVVIFGIIVLLILTALMLTN